MAEPSGKVSGASQKALERRLEVMSPQEKEELGRQALAKLMKSRKLQIAGRQVSLKKAADALQRKRELYEKGVFDEDVRTIPRVDANELVPSTLLRPWSQKQMLRPDEEDALPLQRLGHGNYFSAGPEIFGMKMPWDRNFAYGIFARPNRVRKVMASAWAGRNPEEVLDDPAFYHDMLRRCNQVEMTLMVLTTKQLKLAEVRPAVESTLRHSMERLSGGQPLKEEEGAALQKFIHLLDDQRLEKSGWVKGRAIMKGTHIVVAVLPDGALSAEAITPGPISARKTSFIGTSTSPLLTAAVFDAFVGPEAADPVGRRQTGRGFLWAANGLPFKTARGRGWAVDVADSSGVVDFSDCAVEEHLSAAAELFCLTASSEGPAPRMLVNRIALGSA